MEIRLFKHSDETIWDNFILQESINGTFLQTRRFLNYHSPGKFKDVSLLFYNEKNRLIAVCPACQAESEQNIVFYSHKGSTFGGLIISKKFYKAHYVLDIIRNLKNYLEASGFQEAYLKITPDIFSKEKNALLQYCLFYEGFQELKELNTYISYTDYSEEVISNFAQGKRTNVHNCIKAGLYVKELIEDCEIEEFYSILKENLLKYHQKPVHSLHELLDLKHCRLNKEMEFYGVFMENNMIAASMMFYFFNSNTAHTQYLAAKQDFNKLSPMTFLYYSMIQEMKKKQFLYLSWGVATEHMGKYLNEGLLANKENYGSKYEIQSIFHYNFHKPIGMGGIYANDKVCISTARR